MAGLKLIDGPAVEPVTNAEVKSQLRIDTSDDTFNEQIDALIVAAREWCEGYQNRAFLNQVYDLALDAWPCGSIRLPRPPLVSVDSVKYTDKNNVESTWATSNYLVDDFSEPAEIWPVSSWPSVALAKVNGIVIRYSAGYGTAPDKVPEKVRQAIIMLTAHYFDNGPEADIPQAVKSLLDLDRVVPV